MNRNWEKLLEFIDPVYNYRMLEFNEFKSLFNGFTIGLRDMKELEEDIVVSDLLNHYKMKTLPIEIQTRSDKAKITDFSVIKGKGTDLYFVTFTLSPQAFDLICNYFRAFDRTFRKYKVEFSKAERSLLWKLKNNEDYEYNHRDFKSTAIQLDFDGNLKELPLEQDFENVKQVFESEYKFNKRMKKEKREKREKNKKLRSVAIKSLRLWIKLKMPRLPRYKKEIKPDRAVMWRKLTPKDRKNWLAGYNYKKTMKFNFFGSFIGTELKQNFKVKTPPTVVVVKPEDNHWFKTEEKHLW